MIKEPYVLDDLATYDTVLRLVIGDGKIKDYAAYHSHYEIEIDPNIAAYLFNLSHGKAKRYREMLLNIDELEQPETDINKCKAALEVGAVRWAALHEQTQDILDQVFETKGNQNSDEK